MTIVVILGDSMMKGIKGFEISSKDQKVVVKSFSGATVDCMKDYVKRLSCITLWNKKLT